MSTENERKPGLAVRALLKLEDWIFSPPTLDVGRRRFLKSVPKYGLPAVVVLTAGLAGALWLVEQKRNEDQIDLPPEMLKNLRQGPNGEALFFLGGGESISLRKGKEIVIANQTYDSFYLGYYNKAMNEQLKRQEIILDRIGPIRFNIRLINPKLPLPGVVPGAPLPDVHTDIAGNQTVNIGVNPIGKTTTESLKGTSLAVSASILACLAVSFRHRGVIWHPVLSENLRILRELSDTDKILKAELEKTGSIPPFSLWKELPPKII